MKPLISLLIFIIVVLCIIIYLLCMHRNYSKQIILDKENETPFMVVAKLNSAEATLNFEKGKNFIDLEKVYPEAFENGETPQELWMRICKRRISSGGVGKKNADRRIFKYYDFEIKQYMSGEDSSKVVFTLLKDNRMKKIYSLKKINDKWLVVAINYEGYIIVDSDIGMAF